MALHQWWATFAVECIFICISNQFALQKRRCVFQLNSTNTQQYNKYISAGDVSVSVQVCENTHCCVGYFLVIDDQPEVDLLACDVAEKSCPDATCKAQTRVSSALIKCVCNTDLCNSNITWTRLSEQPRLIYFYFEAAVIFLIGALLVACFVVPAAVWRRLTRDKQENLQACPLDYSVSPLWPCPTETSDIDITDIEVQRIVSHGYFATVWQGKYQECMVAVKVLPASWKPKFTAEKEVYELPLMKHAGIAHFLGAGRKPDGSRFLVLQFAEYGSLHSFLCEHTINWTQSLKLCQTLSQGLSYLHSDLHRYGVHKPPVAHRNLSSSNVLVRADGTCALCDFRCSTVLRSGHRWWHSHTINMKGHRHLGTLCYMSPEILEGCLNLHSSWSLLQADIYALGLLLWEIWMCCSDLLGSIVPQHLFPYESELERNVTVESLITYVCNMSKRPSFPKQWKLLPQGSALQELLTDCWDCDPDARLTAPCVANRLVSLQSDFSP